MSLGSAVAFEANHYDDLKELLIALKNGQLGVNDLDYDQYIN